MSTPFDRQFWEDRYASAHAVWSGEPNPNLVAEVAGLEPGDALDAGAGEGADAVWLAGKGWRVKAVDFSATALERAATRGSDVDWERADLTEWSPEPASYDLVSAQYLHLPGLAEVLPRLGAGVRPGGILLVVGHERSDAHPFPELCYPAKEMAGWLDDGWEILISEPRPGRESTRRDEVLKARRRA
ncbi:class I SAM-dependent methyltransferase [Amycolatopsis acidicola]|uniref:Class I SAM-dependent methyltransferase n=1 Tax=Amycolatopsis acidicola TaxID=2596893 RepID=A0A5N0URT6_9PSEU|nr:class I SAM-dependent methyltransferase [Amycolatopsis acidicola]KAA9150407.1 class I SAM-dependent methyltransferase [Amycolatopsis acidicola]